MKISDQVETINVHYWYSDLSKTTGIGHKSEFDYSKEKRNELIDLFLNYGCEIMIRQFDQAMILFVDNKGGRFRQR